MIFLGLLELLLFIIYGTLVDPTSSIVGGFFEWLTLMTVAFCLGYLYVNHQDRPFFGNVVGNWFIMWLISFQLYFLFVYMWLTIKVGQGINPIFSAGVIRSTNLPLLMLTISYVSLKGFLRLPEVITVSIIGIFAMSCNQYVVHVSLEGYDSTGLTVFLFGSIYGIMIRLIGVPSRSYSVHNKFI